jgi:hypothetical protein
MDWSHIAEYAYRMNLLASLTSNLSDETWRSENLPVRFHVINPETALPAAISKIIFINIGVLTNMEYLILMIANCLWMNMKLPHLELPPTRHQLAQAQ